MKDANVKTTTGLRCDEWSAAASSITDKRNQGARAIDADIGAAPIDAPKHAVAVMLLRDGTRPLSGHPAATILARVIRAAFDADRKFTP